MKKKKQKRFAVSEVVPDRYSLVRVYSISLAPLVAAAVLARRVSSRRVSHASPNPALAVRRLAFACGAVPSSVVRERITLKVGMRPFTAAYLDAQPGIAISTPPHAGHTNWKVDIGPLSGGRRGDPHGIFPPIKALSYLPKKGPK